MFTASHKQGIWSWKENRPLLLLLATSVEVIKHLSLRVLYVFSLALQEKDKKTYFEVNTTLRETPGTNIQYTRTGL